MLICMPTFPMTDDNKKTVLCTQNAKDFFNSECTISCLLIEKMCTLTVSN